MIRSMGIPFPFLPQKRSAEESAEAVKRSNNAQSPEDSHPIDFIAEGKIVRDVRFFSRLDDLDSDDDMNFDPPGSIEVFTDKYIQERLKLDTCEDTPDYDTRGQQETKGYPANWVAYCGVCGEMTDHYSHVCPYRCVAVYEDQDRCFKKFHNDDNHLFRTLGEPSSDIEDFM